MFSGGQSGASGKIGQKAGTFLNERQGNIQGESPL
jgi:hypothetical protein